MKLFLDVITCKNPKIAYEATGELELNRKGSKSLQNGLAIRSMDKYILFRLIFRNLVFAVYLLLYFTFLDRGRHFAATGTLRVPYKLFRETSPLVAHRGVSWRKHPLLLSPFFSFPISRRVLSYPCFHLLCIPWGITRPSVHHVSLPCLLPPSPKLLVGGRRVCLPRRSSRGFPRRVDGRAKLVQIPMRLREQRKPITDSSCAIS